MSERDRLYDCTRCQAQCYPEFWHAEKEICDTCSKRAKKRGSGSTQFTLEGEEYRKDVRKRLGLKLNMAERARDANHHTNNWDRAIKFGVPSHRWHRSEVLHTANYKCFYCGIKVEDYIRPTKGFRPYEAQVDHYIPMSKGGSNLRENVVCACASCNRKKGTKMPEDFIGETL